MTKETKQLLEQYRQTKRVTQNISQLEHDLAQALEASEERYDKLHTYLDDAVQKY